jgi:hypothetical protein
MPASDAADLVTRAPAGASVRRAARGRVRQGRDRAASLRTLQAIRVYDIIAAQKIVH